MDQVVYISMGIELSSVLGMHMITVIIMTCAINLFILVASIGHEGVLQTHGYCQQNKIKVSKLHSQLQQWTCS